MITSTNPTPAAAVVGVAAAVTVGVASAAAGAVGVEVTAAGAEAAGADKLIRPSSRMISKKLTPRVLSVRREYSSGGSVVGKSPVKYLVEVMKNANFSLFTVS